MVKNAKVLDFPKISCLYSIGWCHFCLLLTETARFCFYLSSSKCSAVFCFRLIRTASSTFKDFELASTQQRPDSVLRRRRREQQSPPAAEAKKGTLVAVPSSARRFVRLAVMGLTVALGAAALAVVNSALEWAPKLDLHFFP